MIKASPAAAARACASPIRSRGGGGLCARALGGEILVRRRPRVHRKIHHRSAPHRNPGAGRQARQCHLSRRARMFDPAPQSEGVEEAPSPLLDAATRKKMGEQAVALAKAVGYDSRRHGRVRRRPGQEFLFSGDEHAAAGRASGDRAGHRHRSRRADDPQSRPAKDWRSSRATSSSTAGRWKAASMPKTLSQLPAVDRPAHALSAAGGARERRRHGAQRHRRL